MSEAARLRGYRVPPCFTHLSLSYGIAWDLEQNSHLQAVSSAVEAFSPRVLVVNLMKKEMHPVREDSPCVGRPQATLPPAQSRTPRRRSGWDAPAGGS